MATKVFISYAHESEELLNKVLGFSNYLRSVGIDSEIDQYEESPAEGWPKWMMRQINEADFVLICCSKLLYERANDFSASDEGLGVKWETTLILQQLYSLSTNNGKFIPMVFEESQEKYIPLPLQPYTFYRLSDEAAKNRLVERLLGTSKSKRPPLGTVDPPSEKATPFAPKVRKSMFIASIIDIDLWNRAKWKGMVFLTDHLLRVPPIAGFLFENHDAGKKIFKSLRDQFGGVDGNQEIRLCFIEDISASKPRDYKVHFGYSRDAIVRKLQEYNVDPEETLMTMITRVHEMNPPSESNNLAIFKNNYNHFNRFYITNVMTQNGTLAPQMDNAIEMRTVVFRKKSEVVANRNDEDYVVFA